MNNNNMKNPYVYGLDIGTRSIVGTIGYKNKERFVVVAQESREHTSRAMLDGQIHDIEAVSNTIREVTDALEEKIGEKITQVCIAAAGRVLKTVNVQASLSFDSEKLITKEDVYTLDSYGIEKAYEKFQKSNEDTHIKFYCVGYSVMHYYLNQYPMSNLENHKANEISTDMIATFLPDDVVDGLYRAVELANLEVANLTLEPIAAIELAIPEMYRMLNIALIDVGAGTSDISITRDGSIIAYGMLPIAGDCLTEDIARHCLVDFITAEYIKRQISVSDIVEYKDIMGIPQKISRDEVLLAIEHNLTQMAKDTVKQIQQLNADKPVSAIFVVGGGGKIPTYTEKIAEFMGIANERCAVRGEEVMDKVDFLDNNIQKDSLLVTPIGICLNYYNQYNNFIIVTFNGERIKLYDNNKLAIIDAAMQADFSNEDIFPKRGENLQFTLNGEEVTIRGKRGESATISLNGKDADIHAAIRSNDVIVVQSSSAGEKATMEISKLPESKGSIHLTANGKEISLPKVASVNGCLQSIYYKIKDGDNIELLNYYTVAQIFEILDVPVNNLFSISVNHTDANMDTKVYDNFNLEYGEKLEENSKDELVIEQVEINEVTVNTVIQEAVPEESVPEEKNETKTISALEKAKAEGKRLLEQSQIEKAEAGLERMILNMSASVMQQKISNNFIVNVNGEDVLLKGKNDYIYVDVFEYIDFDLSKPQGKSVETLINGRKAQYTEPLVSGDKLDIFWKE